MIKRVVQTTFDSYSIGAEARSLRNGNIISHSVFLGTIVTTQDATATCHGCVVSGTLRGKTQASCKATIETNTKITGNMPSSGTLHLTLMNSCDW